MSGPEARRAYLKEKQDASTFPRDLRVVIFSWNSNGLKISGDTETQYLGRHSEIVKSRAKANVEMDSGDIRSEIADYTSIITGVASATVDRPHVIFVATQESLKPRDSFHSTALPGAMAEVKGNDGKPLYVLLKRATVHEVGRERVDRLAKNAGVKGLRNSIYVLATLRPLLETSDQPRTSGGKGDFQKSILCSPTRGSDGGGGLASYLRLPTGNVLAFVNCYLPLDVASLESTNLTGDHIRRRNAVMNSNICLNRIVQELGLSLTDKDSREYNPDVLFICGGLNYQVSLDSDARAELEQLGVDGTPDLLDTYKLLFQYDELRREITNGNLYPLAEGISQKVGWKNERGLEVHDDAPFFPTCEFKVDKERRLSGVPAICSKVKGTKICRGNYNLGKGNYRLPSWCDRILYMTTPGKGRPVVSCLEYDKFDEGNMVYSAHFGVTGSYRVSLNTTNAK